MYATAKYDINNTTEKDALSQSQWMNWCRLCAKEDNKNNINFLYQNKEEEHSEYGTKESSIQEALSKYFWVQTSLEDSLPKRLCRDCLSLISSLINFDERVERVQIMFHYLNNFHSNSCDLNSVRLKYNVTEQERDQWFSNYTCTKDIYVDTKCHLLQTTESLHLSVGDKNILSESLQLSEGDQHFEVKNELENGVVLQQSFGDKDHVEKNDNDGVEKGEILSDNNLENFNQEHDELLLECNEKKEKTDNNSEEKSYIKAVLTDEDSSILKPGRNKKTKKGKKLKHCSSSQSKYKRQFIQDYEMEITCKECGINFTKYVAYREHLQQAHSQQMNNKQWPCPVCQLILSSTTNLRQHVLLHGPVEISKPFKCSECDNRYTCNKDLEKHIRTVHRHEKPYICEECGLRFAATSYLKNHILIHHTDIAPYECQVCKKRFKLLKRLKFHMDIHSPNKYMCNICGLQLNSRDTLKRHKVVHSDKAHHKCDYCGKGFKRSNALKNHLLIHTGLKPYSCDFCEHSFGNRSSCRFHMRKKHPDELAALDATGNKVHTKNVPKLEILKAVTKTADNLLPVRILLRGRNSSEKKPKKLKKNEVKPSKLRKKSLKHHTTNKLDIAVSSSSTPLG